VTLINTFETARFCRLPNNYCFLQKHSQRKPLPTATCLISHHGTPFSSEQTLHQAGLSKSIQSPRHLQVGKRSFQESAVLLDTSPDSPQIVTLLMLCRAFHFLSQPFEALKSSTLQSLMLVHTVLANQDRCSCVLQPRTTGIANDLSQY